MQIQTLRCVPFTEVLSRLMGWTGVDAADTGIFLEYFSGYTDFAYGTNSHTLVPWDVLLDDLSDCFAELGWMHRRPGLALFDVEHIFPPDIFTNDPHTFVDLEN